MRLLPDLKTYNPNIENAVLRLADIAEDTENLVKDCLKKYQILLILKKW